jgi:hypothetical protein
VVEHVPSKCKAIVLEDIKLVLSRVGHYIVRPPHMVGLSAIL